MAERTVLDYVGFDEYRNDKGLSVKRDPMYGGDWVLRNSKGKVKDFDKFRDTLAFRNNLELK